jgi:hypothetical protein
LTPDTGIDADLRPDTGIDTPDIGIDADRWTTPDTGIGANWGAAFDPSFDIGVVTTLAGGENFGSWTTFADRTVAFLDLAASTFDCCFRLRTALRFSLASKSSIGESDRSCRPTINDEVSTNSQNVVEFFLGGAAFRGGTVAFLGDTLFAETITIFDPLLASSMTSMKLFDLMRSL